MDEAAIDARRYTFGNDEFSLEYAYHDCKLVFDGITDDDSFQKADTGLILYYANEIIYALQKALEGKDTNVPTNDCISRKDAIDALWGEREKLDSYMDECLKKGLFALRSGTKAERNRIEEDIEIITRLPSAQPDRNAQERYEDLCEYFKDCHDKGMGILGDRKEFKAWLERVHWHVVRCDELGRELEKLQSAQPEIIRCKDCKWWDKYSDTHGYCLAAKHGYWSEHWEISIRRTYDADWYCADAERRADESD